MEIYFRIISLLGGLALFLYGMQIMGDGLKSSSGGALRVALARVTDKPAKGFLLGLLVTCMIQSSTATIVLTVGLVGAGFLKFRQSVGVVLGANVGTAITAQIIRLMDVDAGSGSFLAFLKSDNLAPLALVIGMILIMFVKGRTSDTIGTICMGFGVLFVGLMNMSSAVSAMSDSLSSVFVTLDNNYPLGFLTGVGVTGVIQSSSAVIGILQSVASTVGVKFCGVFAIIIGVNIGDCLTTYLVCRIGAKPEQIRTCLVHIIYNVIAAIGLFITIFILRGTGVLNDNLWNMTLHSGGVANVHGLFRLVPAVLLLPFSGKMANLAERIVKDDAIDEEESDIEKNLRELDIRLIQNPGLALHESDHLIGHMADVCVRNVSAATKQLFQYKEKRAGKIASREQLLDRMADATNNYIIAVSPHITLESDQRTQHFQYKALTVFERIGDLAENINDNALTMAENKKTFSETAQEEIRITADAIQEILELTLSAYKECDLDKARRVEPFEEVIDEIIEELRNRHTARMIKGVCDVFAGIQFQNLMQNFEKISDQCSDLAVYLLGRYDESINGHEHDYIRNLHHSNTPWYLEEFNSKKQKYIGALTKDA